MSQFCVRATPANRRYYGYRFCETNADFRHQPMWDNRYICYDPPPRRASPQTACWTWCHWPQHDLPTRWAHDLQGEKVFVYITFDSITQLTLRIGRIAIEYGIARYLNALLIQDGIHSTSVLDVVLHVQIVEHEGIAQLCILDGLLQGETLRVERDKAIADRPILHGFAQDHVLLEGNQFNELKLPQTR